MPKRHIYLEDIPLAQARTKLQQVLERAGRAGALPGELVPLADALSRVTAAPIRARLSSPHYHCAAMDGYAVRAEDTLQARETQAVALYRRQNAWPVNTGDPLPENTNAVIMIENVNHVDDDALHIYASAAPWQHVRLMGEDMVATETVLQVNHRIRAVDLGALAGCGHHQVNVRRKPRITIIPTGSELVAVGHIPKRGQLIEYNSLMLGAQIREAGGESEVLEIVGDDFEALRRRLQVAVEARPDLILVLSGSSAGSRDFTADAIGELGELSVHGIAVRPGHPVIIGMVEDIPVIGVPGYPVSAALTGELFVIPLIHQWLGLAAADLETIEAVSTRKMVSPIGDDDFVRVALAQMNDRIQATPLQRGAGLITSLVQADGLAHIPRFHEGLDRGARLKVSLYSPLKVIQQTLMMIGSHDPMLDLLATYLRLRSPEHRLISVNVGSIGGLVALRRGEAHLAGIHLFDPESGSYNIPYLKRFLGNQPVQLVTFAHREQGLMVPAGNPQGIQSIRDIRGRSYVNRQRGAGTRVLFDDLLARHEMPPETITGYDHEEVTHLAVAAAIADGIGDCGLGLRRAAEAMNLDFIGITRERFDLAIPHRFLELDSMKSLLAVLQDGAFKAELGKQSGYHSQETGQVVAVSR